MLYMAIKTHKDEIEDGESQGGRIYKTCGEMCAFDSFTCDLSLLSDCDAFCQRPKKSVPDSVHGMTMFP